MGEQHIFSISKAHKDSQARLGTLRLPHGRITTPMFMPVGTNGTVKAMHHQTVESIGYRMILGNTYHLYLRPGTEVIRSYGGLHAFSSWDHNILTDSGGYQIFSLADFRRIQEKGVRFRSHIDGSYHELSPEDIVDTQRIFGSDIMMCLDVCTPPDIPYNKAEEALRITTSWAKRSKGHWSSGDQTCEGKLFGIIQGNFFKELRKRSAGEIGEIDFPGIAIGGLSVGEPKEVFEDFLSYTVAYIEKEKPRYVMGIGTPDYILEAVSQGIDIFDCVFATRTARNGTVFTDDGMISLKKAVHAFDRGPIAEGCPCRACTTYSRGYLRHLFKTNEILGPMLTTEHNLTYLYQFMENIRRHIQGDTFDVFKKDFLDRYRRAGQG